MSTTFIILLGFILHSICCLIIYYAMYKYLIRKWIKEYNKSYPNINEEYYKQRQEMKIKYQRGLNEQLQKMEKTQQRVNDKIAECLEDLSESIELSAKNRDIMMKLLKFEGHRIDTLENKIDLLMTDRAEDIAKKAEPVIPNEEIHFNDYHFEVAQEDNGESKWYKCITLGDHDDGWRLPTVDELRLMYLCKGRLGMEDEEYWSSSEYNFNFAWGVNFSSGTTYFYYNDNSLRVRLVRTIDE